MNKLKMIVAFSKNKGIGINNTIPWHIPEDYQYFKYNTSKIKNTGIIMGKKTWLSLPRKPLPNRENIILSKTLTYSELKKYPNIKIFKSYNQLNIYLAEKKEPSWVIGGNQVYQEFIKHPMLDEIYVTYINKNYECDTFFPKIPNTFKPLFVGPKKFHEGIIYNNIIFKKSQ